MLDSAATAQITGLARDVHIILESVDFTNLDFLLLLPHDDERFNYMLRAAFAQKTAALRCAVIEGSQATEIITLYSLYAFSDKLIIGSLDLPHGRKLRNLLDSGYSTETELINDVILGKI